MFCISFIETIKYHVASVFYLIVLVFDMNGAFYKEYKKFLRQFTLIISFVVVIVFVPSEEPGNNLLKIKSENYHKKK